MRGERPQPGNRFPRAVAERASASKVKLSTQPSVTSGSKRKPWATVAGMRMAAGAATGSFAASNETSPPPRSINRI